MKLKQAFTSLQLPGKPSAAFKEAKKGYREVNGYAAYKGLSEAGNRKPPQLRQGSVKDVQRAVLDDALRAESPYPLVQAMGNMDVRSNMRTNGGSFQKAMKKAGY